MAKETLYVIDSGQRVPFLRGMITHSLVKRGLSFQEAYQTASLVRDRIRPKGEVTKEALVGLIDEIVADRFGEQFRPTKSSGSLPTVLIEGPEGKVPFSKGMLSQSLQATGMDPSVSYDIAREIEGVLWSEKRGKIGRDELRRLIYRTILHNHDGDTATRYLLWRYFKTPDKPLLILFGGATGVGKSTLAAEVAYRLGIQKVVSTDTIRQIMRTMFSRELLPAIHFSSYEAWQHRARREAEEHAVAVVEAFKEQTLPVLVGVRAMIERAVQENASVVIDGVHLVPGLLELGAFDQRIHIVPLVVSTLDRRKFAERFSQRETTQEHRQANKYSENLENILLIQNYVLDMAELADCPIVENRSLDETVSSILSVIASSVMERSGLDREKLIGAVLGEEGIGR